MTSSDPRIAVTFGPYFDTSVPANNPEVNANNNIYILRKSLVEKTAKKQQHCFGKKTSQKHNKYR